LHIGAEGMQIHLFTMVYIDAVL